MIVETKGLTVDTEAADWTKSSYSDNSGGNCVEVAPIEGGVAVRDSKNPNGGVLLFTVTEWTAFGAGLVAGDFDDL